jgi:hypothetical protein
MPGLGQGGPVKKVPPKAAKFTYRLKDMFQKALYEIPHWKENK